MQLSEFTAWPVEELPSEFLRVHPGGKPVTCPFHFQDVFPETEGALLYSPLSVKRKGRVFLSLSYVFYASQAFLNGQELGGRKGYVYPHIFELTPHMAAQNHLFVLVTCKREKVLHRKEQILGVFGHWDCKQPKLKPGGIAGEARLLFKPLTLIRRLLLLPQITERGVLLRVQVVLDSGEGGRGKLELKLSPKNFSGEAFSLRREVFFPQGLSYHEFSWELPRASLWYPFELGAPDLYNVEVALRTKSGLDRVRRPIGFREVRVERGKLLVNGEPIFLRGSNLAPPSFHLGKATRQDYRKLLKLAQEAHCNALRVHAHVDKEPLYSLCDEAGMLLFQDFPLQWGYHKKITQEAVRQIRKMFFALHHHPSIFLFCCHNEPFLLPSTDPEQVSPYALAVLLSSTFLYNDNKDILDRKLERTLRSFSPPQLILRASGLYRTLFHPPTDAHIYCGWYQGKKEHLPLFLLLFPEFRRFITEFGAQALPSLESLREWGVSARDFPRLQRDYLLQPSLLRKYVSVEGKSEEELVELSQKYQAELIRYYIAYYRTRKYKPALGYFHFILNDGCPGATWSVVDVSGRKKRGYATLQQASAPLTAFLTVAKKRGMSLFQWTIVSDRKTPLSPLFAQVLFSQGEKRAKRVFQLHLPADSVYRLPPLLLAAPPPLTASLHLEYNGKTYCFKYCIGGTHATAKA